MWGIYSAVLILGLSTLTESYSKYGRSCSDIGCTSNEKCVMKSDPCSFGRKDDCGQYPTCERVSSNSHRTCSGYVCPPSMICRIESTGPRCVTDASAVGKVPSYDTQNLNNIGGGSSGGSGLPSAPQPPGHFPGPTTHRPGIGGNYNGAGGYQGGAIGSGYPGGAVGSGYPGQQWSGGSAGQGSYPNNGYNNRGQYPNGYPNQYSNGQYPNSGQYPNNGQYPNTGYNPYGTNNYGNQNGYGRNTYGSYGYGYNGASSSDSLADQLKTIGTDILKSTLTKLIMGDTRNNNANANYNNGAYRPYYN